MKRAPRPAILVPFPVITAPLGVIPAKAGIQLFFTHVRRIEGSGIPAFAGMTGGGEAGA